MAKSKSSLPVKDTLCKECGQPMLPKGVKKRPSEYDHASGCPLSSGCPLAPDGGLASGDGILSNDYEDDMREFGL